MTARISYDTTRLLCSPVRDQQLHEGAIARAIQLRTELRDRALAYADAIALVTREVPSSFHWILKREGG